MEHKTYITNRRAKIQGIGGYVNLPYGTEVSVEGRFLYYQGKSICSVTSNNAHTYFSQNDDGNGVRRGNLVRAIKNTLERRDLTIRTVGTRCGRIHFVKSIRKRGTRTIGFGTTISTTLISKT